VTLAGAVNFIRIRAKTRLASIGGARNLKFSY